MSAPTQSAVSSLGINLAAGGPLLTGAVSWSVGDRVIVLGMTADNAVTFATPTNTGTALSFSALAGIPTNSANSCKGYAWLATAGASSSGVMSVAFSGGAGPSQFGFIIVFVYSGSDGLGTPVVSATLGTTTTQNLTRVQANSAVIQIWGDWNAVNDTTVTWTPSGQTQHVAQNSSSHFTGFSASWPDQGATGTTAYGFSGFAGGNMTAITIEVKGTVADFVPYHPVVQQGPILAQ